jgi:hypothetical protein
MDARSTMSTTRVALTMRSGAGRALEVVASARAPHNTAGSVPSQLDVSTFTGDPAESGAQVVQGKG